MINVFKKTAQFLSSKHDEFTFKEQTYSGTRYSFLVTEDLQKPCVLSKFINFDNKQTYENLDTLKPMQQVTLKISHYLKDGKIEEKVTDIIL